MMCENCGKNEANFRYTQIINGVKKEVRLCSECARKLGLDNIDIPINFTSFLGDFFNDYAESALLPSLKMDEAKCKNCGMTYNDFIDTGMFGCSECYDVFSNPIDSLLKNLHGTAKHIGRGAKGEGEPIKEKVESKKLTKKEELEAKIEKAIKEERYEDAAKLRDEIKEMNK